jgi:hypothetical protein
MCEAAARSRFAVVIIIYPDKSELIPQPVGVEESVTLVDQCTNLASPCINDGVRGTGYSPIRHEMSQNK